jgi:hypothetical protein
MNLSRAHRSTHAKTNDATTPVPKNAAVASRLPF